VADQLEDGRVLSGVGGQYNFVAQGHALEGARSILLLRSWREAGGEVSSNLFWTYGHCTIPRHLRDIVVTEYGIADLRGQTDSEVIARLLAVSDSRFQPGLIEQAKDAGKLPKTFSWIRALPTTPATPGGDQGAACAAVPGVSAGHGLYGRGAGSACGR
jgi:acyl-CoA hydrolase